MPAAEKHLVLDGDRVELAGPHAEEGESLSGVRLRVDGRGGLGMLLAQLLSAATERLKSAFGVLVIPDKDLCLEHVRDAGRIERALRRRASP